MHYEHYLSHSVYFACLISYEAVTPFYITGSFAARYPINM